ncbi:TetR family transcriptional regulator [Marinobacter sp. M216]|uniref:TetR family transcriptional regulator n=1 Tax=Marinobacter albus TaxID=3030833 RepID=A0ABT7HFZ3_9GAMM|nr:MULTISPECIES: TetR/AcrR family transcriptional regulator [unclassified Marinobacter]MBW7471871.1 TetR/AcrR family transcriptional regulator [Marinobacter sp. F4218]MDK9558441.1 TetR family transcriptional regulator [Marinobacter sp. M216]
MARNARYDRTTALQKAVTLFWERGYHGSSMKQIEQALDMRPGSIYASFGNKDNLFSEALAMYADQGAQELSGYLQEAPSIVDGLQAYLRGIANGGRKAVAQPSRACMIVKTLLESSNTHPALARQAQRILASIQDVIHDALEQAKAQGELIETTDCQRLARLLQAQIVALRSMAERKLAPEELSELGDDVASILDSYRTQH